MKTRIVLASKSPRREALLRGLELPCELEVVPADIDESCYQMSVPRAQAAVLSVVKAQAVAQQYPLSIVIGADTVVELDGVMMGKPKDEAQAREMLTALSDKTHTVHTGIALCCRGEVFSDVVSSRVTFRALEPEEIDRYIASGEPFDKAGRLWHPRACRHHGARHRRRLFRRDGAAPVPPLGAAPAAF